MPLEEEYLSDIPKTYKRILLIVLMIIFLIVVCTLFMIILKGKMCFRKKKISYAPIEYEELKNIY